MYVSFWFIERKLNLTFNLHNETIPIPSLTILNQQPWRLFVFAQSVNAKCYYSVVKHKAIQYLESLINRLPGLSYIYSNIYIHKHLDTCGYIRFRYKCLSVTVLFRRMQYESSIFSK